MITSDKNGKQIEYTDDQWIYSDTKESIFDDLSNIPSKSIKVSEKIKTKIEQFKTMFYIKSSSNLLENLLELIQNNRKLRYEIIPEMIPLFNFQEKSWDNLNKTEKIKSPYDSVKNKSLCRL